MTLRMMWSSASISSGSIGRCAILGLCLALLATGCARRQTATVRTLRGTVNLDILIKHHPGWNGISQYDTALGRLADAVRQVPPAGQADDTIAILPALPEANIVAANASDVELASTASRLEAIKHALLSSLRQRRELERLEQLRQEGELRQREANRLFNVATSETPISPDLDLQLLSASIVALTKTVGNWDLSLPPSPDLKRLRAKVILDRARLESLIAERAQQREAAAQQQRNEALSVLNARADYVRTHQLALEARLILEDERLIAAQHARLSLEQNALLHALAQPGAVGVPAAGNAGVLILPRGPGIIPARLSQASLTASEERLRLQRARWLNFLRDDTVSAAQDTAKEQHWEVTFGPPRPGDRDLTEKMTQALTSGIWRL